MINTTKGNGNITPGPVTKAGSNTPQKKSKWWLWLLLCCLVVAVLLIVLLPGKDKKESEPAVVETEQVVAPVEPSTLSAAQPEAEVSEAEEVTQSETLTPKSEEKSVAQTTKNVSAGEVEENALKAIRGDYGNGQDRKEALADKYTVIQNRVNQIYKENDQNWP